MKKITVQWTILIFFIFLFQLPAIARPNPPVALLVNGTGTLSFSKDGSQWAPVNRNKLLFIGDFVKTGHDGSCKLLFQDTQYAKYIEKNSRAIVKEKNLELLAGNARDSKVKTFNLLDNLRRKFAKINRYTTVQRSKSKSTDAKFCLPKSLVISQHYPTIAWENQGANCSYRLMFQGKTYVIPKSSKDIIRFNLSNLKPGLHEYTVSVLKDGNEFFSQSASLVCLSTEASEEAFNLEKNVREISDQGFLLGLIMDDKGLKVPALDHYLRFFEKGNYDNNVYPFLIKVYDDLGMKHIAKKEIKVFNQKRK